MIRRRDTPDGLPFRVYERRGVRVYSIGYKLKSGKWAFRYECPITDTVQIAALRRRAIQESATITDAVPIGGFAGLVDAWFKMQDDLPPSSAKRRADSTIAENKREAANLVKAWGHLEPADITKAMGYDYLDACEAAGRPEKGNKEMALARLILEYGIRKRMLDANPLAGLRKNKTVKTRRRVTREEMDLAVDVGRKMGGARLIVALALRTAWLCVRRSVEVRALLRQAITDDGILWQDGKARKGTKPAILIEWSPELRATITEALEARRSSKAGSMYLFGNVTTGNRYTKGGWKKTLENLMVACEAEAERRGVQFAKFSLQDCRPMGVSDKLEQGHQDVQDATLHSDGKMVARVYDRRAHKTAKPAA